MQRFVIRELIALAAAFVVCPLLTAFCWGAHRPDDLLIITFELFLLQFLLPLYLWIIPLALGSVAGLLWHCIAEISGSDS